jgi:hypothetical protein
MPYVVSYSHQAHKDNLPLRSDMPNPRVSIYPQSFKALNIQSAIEGKAAIDVISDMVMKSLSPEARRALEAIEPDSHVDIVDEQPDRKVAIRDRKIDDHKVTVPNSQKATKRPKLRDNQEALAAIKELWASGEHNAAAIAKRIGYPRATAWENIKRMQERGELVQL